MKYGIYAATLENAAVRILWIFKNNGEAEKAGMEKVAEANTKREATETIRELCDTEAYVSL